MNDPQLSARGRQMLEQSLEQINALRNASPRDPNFKEWRQSTLTLIQRIWEGDQARSARFRRIPFSPPSSRADTRTAREWYEKGAAEAAALLRALIDELSGGAPVADFEEGGPPALEMPVEDEVDTSEPPAADPAKPGPAIPRVPRPGAARPSRRDDEDDENAPAPKRLAELRALIGRDTPSPRRTERTREEQPPQFDDPPQLSEPPRAEEPPRPAAPPPSERSTQGGSVSTSKPNGKNKHKKSGAKARLKDMLGFGDENAEAAAPEPPPPARRAAPEPPPRQAAPEPRARQAAPTPEPPPSRQAAPEAAPRAGSGRAAANRPQRPAEPAPSRQPAPPPDDIASVLPPQFELPVEHRRGAMPKGWPHVASEPEPDLPTAEEMRDDIPEEMPEEAPIVEDASPFAESAPPPPVDEAMLRAALEAALGPMSAPEEEEFEEEPAEGESAEDLLKNSPVFRAQATPVRRRGSQGATPQAPSPVVSAAAAAVLAMAAEVGSLGVPEGQRSSARSALLDLARHLEHHDLTWDVLREAVTFVMEYPAIGRRVLPLLLPYLEEAA